MKVGLRTPSISKSVKARTVGRAKRAVKSSINPAYGKKGVGLITNPKKSIYSKVYNKTAIGLNDILSDSKSSKKSSTKTNDTVEKLIDERLSSQDFQQKLEAELAKNGYTMEDLENAIMEEQSKNANEIDTKEMVKEPLYQICDDKKYIMIKQNKIKIKHLPVYRNMFYGVSIVCFIIGLPTFIFGGFLLVLLSILTYMFGRQYNKIIRELKNNM